MMTISASTPVASRDFLADEFGLPLGEHAAASADANGLHWRSRSGRKRSRMASTLLNFAAQIFFALQAARGIEQHFLEKLIDQGFDLFALLGREAGNAVSTLANELRRVRLSVCGEERRRRRSVRRWPAR